MSKCDLMSFMTLLIAALAEAKPVLTVTCNSPKGTSVDYGTGQFGTGMKVETNKDGYRGDTPVFVIDDAKPNKMLVIWGESKTLGPAAETKATEAIIIHQTANQISAVEPYEVGAWLYTLYPKLGIGYFSRHSHQYSGTVSVGVIFYSLCKFSS